VVEPGDPVMIVVGGDALALSTAEELCAVPGHRVVVLWNADPGLDRAVEGLGAVFVGASPETDDGLARAGAQHAAAIVALSPDDRLNLHAALRARDANPDIRIVLRQFNRTLAGKIQQNLSDCSVLSLAWHSAATYAAAAVDPGCFRALQFPEPDGPLTGFATRGAEAGRVAGHTAEEAEHTLGARVIAVDGRTDIAPDRRLDPAAQLTLFGEIARLQGSVPRPMRPRSRHRGPRISRQPLWWLATRIDRSSSGWRLRRWRRSRSGLRISATPPAAIG